MSTRVITLLSNCSIVLFFKIKQSFGFSNGEDIPVKSFISPILAFLYNPLGSRDSQVDKSVSINTSINLSTPIISFACVLFFSKGDMKEQ